MSKKVTNEGFIYNFEIKNLYNEPNINEMIKCKTWMEYVLRMIESCMPNRVIN